MRRKEFTGHTRILGTTDNSATVVIWRNGSALVSVNEVTLYVGPGWYWDG